MGFADEHHFKSAVHQPEKRKKLAKEPLHMRRVPVEIRMGAAMSSSPLIIPARLFFTDFKPSFIRVYANRPLNPGAAVSLSILDTKKVYLSAQVLWCKLYHLERQVVRRVPYEYRIQFTFATASTEELEQIRLAAEDFHFRLVRADPERVRAQEEANEANSAPSLAPMSDAGTATEAEAGPSTENPAALPEGAIEPGTAGADGAGGEPSPMEPGAPNEIAEAA